MSKAFSVRTVTIPPARDILFTIAPIANDDNVAVTVVDISANRVLNAHLISKSDFIRGVIDMFGVERLKQELEAAA